MKARKIVPFSVFHSNLSGINPNLQSMSTNDASAAVPNFQMQSYHPALNNHMAKIDSKQQFNSNNNYLSL